MLTMSCKWRNNKLFSIKSHLILGEQKFKAAARLLKAAFSKFV
jgi:hypothetical protein